MESVRCKNLLKQAKDEKSAKDEKDG